MSRLLAATLFSVLVFTAVPAAAQDAPASTATATPAVACANPDALEVITPAGPESDITTPAFDGPGEESKDYLVDLGASSADANAPLDIVLTWELTVNDYDLGAGSAVSTGYSENYQPFDPTEEKVHLDVVKHCEVITVRAVNFLAPVDVDELTLAFTVGPVATPASPSPSSSQTRAP